MPRIPAKLFAVGRAAVLAVVVVVALGSGAWMASVSSAKHEPAVAAPAAPAADKLGRDGRDGLTVPKAIAESMGLSTGSAARPTRPRKLAPFQGVLAYNNNRLARVHSRFAGEVTGFGTTTDPVTGSRRQIQDGDTVKAGDLLAVVWSKDLGLAKSALVDAISQLRTSQVALDDLQNAYQSGAVPAAKLRDATRAVENAQVTVRAAEQTLRTYRLTEDEVRAVRAEADRLRDPKASRRSDPDWARVEVFATRGGQLQEMNLTAVGDIVDTASTLFYIADLSELMVWVDIYEDDLPAVQALPKPVSWTVSLVAQPGRQFPGTLEQIKSVIDPVQHTARAVGRLANPDGSLKVGQGVIATVELPPPADEVEVPAAAVVEDGKSSLVFVQPDPAAGRYVRTPVTVRRRFSDVLYTAADPTAGVKPGDRVVTAGALLLRDALDQLPAAK